MKNKFNKCLESFFLEKFLLALFFIQDYVFYFFVTYILFNIIAIAECRSGKILVYRKN